MYEELIVHTVADLMLEAGLALANRDASRLERLSRIAQDWMQGEKEAEGIRVMLAAMTEAAYMLDGEPSEVLETL